MEKRLMTFIACLFLSLGMALAQTQVSGTVTSSDDGSPVVGASIKVAGTNTGTVTDIDGNFSLNAPANAKLEISYIGMIGKTVKAGKNMKIVLDADNHSLDDVVVVAYGTAKKSSLTGAVTSVDSKAIEKTISTSVTGALEGKAAGVQVNNTYGEPGSAPTIRIRGFGSVNGSNDPLYVVDGVPYDGNISDLNSNDIESLTVLKDAASAALYGNRAANGVVLITTKRADLNDKPMVTFKTNLGAYTRGVKDYDRLGANQWMEAQWTAFKNNALTSIPSITDEATAASYATANLIGDLVKRNIYDKADDQLFDANGKLVANILPGYTDLDWEDALERTGFRQDYDLSFAASGKKYNVYASVGYLKENGYILNTGFERFSGRVNASFTPTSWFKGGLNIAGSSQNKNYNSNAYSSLYSNPFYSMQRMAPVYPIYLHNADGTIQTDENGNPVYDTTSDYLANRHIIYERLNDTEKNERLTLDATAYATFVLPYGFEATVKGTKSLGAIRRSIYGNPEIGDGAANNGRLQNYDYRTQTTTFQQQLNWAHDYDVHHVDALLAHESYEYKYSNVYGMNTNMSVAGNLTMGNFTTNSNYLGYDLHDATESYLGRVRYNYDGKYFAEASWRTDGSSRFYKDNRWGNFFSFGAAWDITKENFMKDVKWVDFLKLRASYGEVGNNFVDDGSGYANYYAYQALYYLDKNNGNGSLVKQSLAANDVKWETTQTVDIALEANLFNRVQLQLGYFDKRSKDLLFAVPLPSSAGAFIWNENSYNLTQLKNLGTVSNRGIELSIGVDAIKNKDWKWNVGLDMTWLKNKIVKLPNGDDVIDATSSLRRFSEGHSIYEFYTYHFEGVDQMTGNSLFTLDPEQKEAAEANGQLVTINGTDYTTDNTYGKKDWAGTALPTVYGSIHSDLTWKGLTLNMLMTYSLGGKVYDSSYQSLMETAASSASALHKDVLKSWTGAPEGMTETSANRIDPNGTPVLNSHLSQYNNGTSDRWLTSASYLVMKNITLSYQLPRLLVRSWGLQDLILNAGVENAFTITSRTGLNPQYDFKGTQDATYVTARIFNFGLTLKF